MVRVRVGSGLGLPIRTLPVADLRIGNRQRVACCRFESATGNRLLTLCCFSIVYGHTTL